MGLSVWQVKRQLAYLTAQALWPDAPDNIIFGGGGFVGEDLEGNYLPGSAAIDGPKVRTGTDKTAGVTPFARVQCLDVEYDKSSNANRPREVMLRVWTLAGGGSPTGPGVQSLTQFDTHGENQVNGTNRDPSQGSGKSAGRDVDELIDGFLTGLGVVGFVPSVHGFQGYVVRKTLPRPVAGAGILRRAFEVCISDATEQNYYHGASHVAGSSPGAGQVTLTWIPAPGRFDSSLGTVRRGTLSGDAAPTDPNSGGTLVSNVVAANSVGISDTPGVGTWNYAYWPGYAETISGVRDRFGVRRAVQVTA